MTELLASIRDWMDQLEALATDAVARIAPWAAPVPTAYLVGRSIVEHLHWPTIVGVVAAVLVECLGLATTATALELREFNRSKGKSDPAAPFVVSGRAGGRLPGGGLWPDHHARRRAIVGPVLACHLPGAVADWRGGAGPAR